MSDRIALKCLRFALIALISQSLASMLQADPARELRLAISQDLEQQARAAVKTFLRNYEPALPRQPQFEFNIEVDLAQNPERRDFEMSEETGLLTFAIKTVYVFLKLEQVTTDLALHNDVAAAVQQFLTDFFENQGFSARGESDPISVAPKVLVRVTTWTRVQQQTPADLTLINTFTKILIAGLLLMLVFLLRRRKTVPLEQQPEPIANREPKVVLPGLRQQESPLDIPMALAAETLIIDAEPVVTPIMGATAAPRPRNILGEPVSEMNFHPQTGSWYIASLQDASSIQLQEAFERIPFEQAMQVLRSFRPNIRNDILTRLNLRPAIRRKVEEQFRAQEI